MEVSTPAEQLASRTGYVLVKLGEAALDATERTLAPLGLRAKHLSILTLIESHRLSQQELSTITGLDRTTMVGLVDALEHLGYATRERDETDRRRYVVSPTRAGIRLLRKAESELDRTEGEMYAVLSPTERRTLHRLAAQVLDRVTNAPTVH